MKKAFTLAEVLVTLAIIGVVAALTISSAIQKYQQHVLYTQFIKVISDLNRALQASSVEGGYARDWIVTGNIYNVLSKTYPIEKYLSIEKKCLAIEGDRSCFADKYYNLSGNEINNISYQLGFANSYLLTSGVSIMVYQLAGTDPFYNMTFGFYIDTNGFKRPNTMGRDLFQFVLNRENNTIEPIHYRIGCYQNGKRSSCVQNGLEEKCKTDNVYCGAYIFQKGKMDY